MDPQMARIKYGGSRANSKCIVNSYIDYLNMSQIEEEERMSDDVVASINSRKFSKATQNQSDNISVLISKEHSFSKNKFKEEARIDKQNQELIAEVDTKQEVLSSESRRESSTKIEEAHESPAVLSGGTEFQRSTTDTEEKNSSSKKKQAHPDKPGTKNLSTSCLKTTPKVIQNSLQKQSKDNKTSSKISNLEVKKIISTVNLGSSMTKNIILEKNKDQTQSIIVSSNQNPVPTLIINKSSKNHQSQHSHGTKQTQQTLKLPAERMSEKHSKKPQAQVKKTGNHRRTNSDTNNFSQVAHIINPLVTSARNTLKAPPSSNILSHKDHTQKEQAESAKTVPSKNVMMPSSVIKRKELDDLDVHHELRKQIAILKNENLHLKQENESFKKILDRNNIVIEKYSKLVDLVHKSKAISSIIPKGLLEFPQDRDCTPQKNKLISPRISHLSKKPTPSSEYLHKTSANSKLRKQNSDIQPSGTLSKKSENCNSAKELRDKRKGFLTEKNENHGSEKDARNQLKYNTNK